MGKKQNDSIATLMEYQRKLDIVTDQMTKISVKISALDRAKRVSLISLSSLDNDTVTYYSQLGRCFVATPKECIREELKDTQKEAVENLPRLKSTLEKFDILRKEQIKAIRELTEST